MAQTKEIFCDLLIIGGGIAGLTAAKQAGPQVKTIVLTKSQIGESATGFAQGGIAAAVSKNDSPTYHFEDTIKAGAGLCNPDAVKVLVEEGVERVKELIKMGASFDRHGLDLELTLEAAHGKRRILHAGDHTGEEIERTLGRHVVSQGKVKIHQKSYGKELLVENERCCAATAIDSETGDPFLFHAKAIILSTGGVSHVYINNSNPPSATGDGIAMAYRAGAEVTDMEFVQFHPTTLTMPNSENRFLISESVRGEGAILLNIKGERFMPQYHPAAELAPRDIVSRAVLEEMKKTNSDHVFLDFSPVKKIVEERFPSIYEECKKHGFDINKDKVPVSPAAHYAMGGVKTDLNGQTNIAGLFAAGETACVGVHGANRLASNSLLDGLVFGHRAARKAIEYIRKSKIEIRNTKYAALPPPSTSFEPEIVAKLKRTLQKLMWKKAGIIRDEKNLKEALKELEKLEKKVGLESTQPEILELKNMLLVSKLITQAALDRQESRGAHYRTDFPKTNDKKWGRHLVYRAGKSRTG